MRTPCFKYPRRVAYHETDAMGVMHHANHVKLFEEARVAYLRSCGLMDHHQPYGPYVFAVTHQDARYFKPCGFDEPLEILTQVKMDGARIRFQYAIYSEKQATLIADGSTTLVPIDSTFRPVKLPATVLGVLKSQPWSEVWPPESKIEEAIRN